MHRKMVLKGYTGAMLILLHTSKTMHQLDSDYGTGFAPPLVKQSRQLASYLAGLSTTQLQTSMNINQKLAAEVHVTMQAWNDAMSNQRSAIFSFAGDIYSGLQVQTWSPDDLTYAQQHLRILSGLYGILRPLDGIMPYRLELGYRLPDKPYRNLYAFWGDKPAATLPKTDIIIDLAAKEYSKLVLPYTGNTRVVSPKFLTISPKTGEPTFVVVHAKIARGAFAAWLVKNRIEDASKLRKFSELGYKYDDALSTGNEPVFVCHEFGGIGLSVRLQHKK